MPRYCKWSLSFRPPRQNLFSIF